MRVIDERALKRRVLRLQSLNGHTEHRDKHITLGKRCAKPRSAALPERAGPSSLINLTSDRVGYCFPRQLSSSQNCESLAIMSGAACSMTIG